MSEPSAPEFGDERKGRGSQRMTGANEPSQRLVIAIDGPSGSGKSSTARGVAQRLGLAYLDTGAMYRAATWWALHEQVDLATPEAVADAVAGVPLAIATDPTQQWVQIAGNDVTTAIREPNVAAHVSKVARVPRVRGLLIRQQRDLIAAAESGIVVEGRDITTVVAPDATLRVLLVADPQARVARRQAELGEQVSGADVDDQVLRRDRDDSAVTAFTEAAPGVTVLDSTSLSLAEVIDHICAMVKQPRQDR